MIKVIVFDFDGVIIDSNKMKYDAYFDVFEGSPVENAIIEGVLKTHREKTRGYIIGEILKRAGADAIAGHVSLDEAVAGYSMKYNAIVERGAVECPEIKGASAAAARLSVRYPLYINSTTPDEPLLRILEKRSLAKYFKGVYGGARTKVKCLQDIMNLENANGGEAVVIGDGLSDRESAMTCGARFIGVRNEYNAFDGEGMVFLDDLERLEEMIA